MLQKITKQKKIEDLINAILHFNSRANESGHQKEGCANTDIISYSRTLHILLHFMSALYTESLALVIFVKIINRYLGKLT